MLGKVGLFLDRKGILCLFPHMKGIKQFFSLFFSVVIYLNITDKVDIFDTLLSWHDLLQIMI